MLSLMFDQNASGSFSLPFIEKTIKLYHELNRAVEQLGIAVSLYGMIVMFGVMPIMCCSLYLMIHLVSSPEMRTIAVVMTGTIVFVWTLIYLGFAMVYHAAEKSYKPLNSLAVLLKPTSNGQVLIKMDLDNMLELIGSKRIGVKCYNVFTFDHEFILKVLLSLS